MQEINHLTMHDLPEGDRPYEKLLRQGAAVLSDAELMAVVIRSGSRQESALTLCQRLLALSADGRTGSTAEEGACGLAFLRQCAIEELTGLPGIGPVKAVQIKAALELGLRAGQKVRPDRRLQVRNPRDIMLALEQEMADLPREELRTVLLDVRNRIIRICKVCEGGLSAAVIEPRDLFREAVKANASALILAHNHPSGDASPSQEDLDTTRRLRDIGDMMGIRVIDHLILAQGGSVSLKQSGLM